ncbi:restriction endonuclease subunit S [Aromatoleum sp.]|uniref:restriction endonuclease subunit S n=1 Tax=Aromatoleum sp. TaxID=2307007 RepID=UPI002FC7432E
MSFPRYEQYKDSGVEWLGDIPAHWDADRLRGQVLLLTEKTQRRTGAIALENIESWSGRFLDTDSEFQGDGVAVEAGDILFGKLRPYLAKVFVVERPGEAVGDFHVMRTRSGVHPRFLFYSILNRDFISIIDGFTYGAKMPRASWDFMGSMPVVVPTPFEQAAIVAFLDRETPRMDALVAEQQNLIALLKEKRQALISHAVTKGLDSTAPMKDSGVAWLGEVPAHWERVQLGRVCNQIADGPHFSPSYVSEGVMFLSARNIGVESWYLDDVKFVSESDYLEFCKRVIPEKGDVLYTKGGTTGVARVVDLDDRFQVWVHVAVLKLNQELVNPSFLAYALNSVPCYEQSQLHTRGATNHDLGLTRMAKIWFARPDLAEQGRIVAFLDDQTIKIDNLVAEAENSIALLQERRTALISAAITGKIDVRGLVRIPAEMEAEAA